LLPCLLLPLLSLRLRVLPPRERCLLAVVVLVAAEGAVVLAAGTNISKHNRVLFVCNTSTQLSLLACKCMNF
jgi:hypothetical protein